MKKRIWVTADANADLTEYINKNKIAYSSVEGSLTDLQDGTFPQKYRDAMQDSIATTLQKTLGTTVNELAQRGNRLAEINQRKNFWAIIKRSA